MQNLQKTIIIVLCVVALFMGYLIYRQKYPSRPIDTSFAELANAQLNQKTTDESYLFSISNTSSEQEKQKHYQYAVSIAESSPELELLNCKSSPLVWRVKNNSQIKIQNNNNVDLEISFNSDRSYAVPANSSKEIKAEFGIGPGLYGYGYKCILPTGIIQGNGMILVTP